MRFKNYFNKISNKRDIYSIDDLEKMTLGDAIDKEDELGYQHDMIGMPEIEELRQSPNVEEYTNDLGNPAWRSKELNVLQDTMPMENDINSFDSDFITGFAVNNKSFDNIDEIIQDGIEKYNNLPKGSYDILVRQMLGTTKDFIKNYSDMKKANTHGADKYFHSKANCEGAQRGIFGEGTANIISDLREFSDFFKNPIVKQMSIKDSIQDSKEDNEANEYGRRQGKKYPKFNSRDLVKKYRPNGLPNRY